MDYKAIEQLIKAMNETNLTHLEIEEDNLKIKMKKEKEVVSVANIEPKIAYKEEGKEVSSIDEIDNTSAFEEKEGTIIYSPIVGTFYSAPAPDAPPFVSIGDRVKKGDTLCIIEAMKLMNEIESEVDGEVVEIFVKNEEMVEYNQPLFRIKG
ncbi:acetyl-CoA carboxylase biotin carboxyl carrier protein [Defluviitalea phaphyphila]|uniref:acetyl-CoA carboxylase biotin carboxyl carrier protein n=1 Tax=Defluviitalea phaphyphila TaxID=1473580 RepID=UPI00073035C0|nr:acetyl-CoA carboxylase biotin carboxyl carrier protein [Defluviitalea phaphyphila]